MSAPASASASAAPVAVTSGRGRRFGGRAAWLAVGGYLLGAVVLTVRLWPGPASRAVAGNPYDTDQFAWFMRYAATAVSHGQLPALAAAAMNAPQGLNMMWNPSTLLPGVLLAPVTLLAGPQASLTLLLTLGFAGSAACMFWVLRRWGCSTAAAFAGGFGYGFSPALVHSALGHYDLQFAVLPPLIADAALHLVTGRRIWHRGLAAADEAARPGRAAGGALLSGGWLGLLCAAQLLIDEEVLFDTALAVVLLTVVLAVSRPRAAAARLRHVAAGAGAALGAAALLAGYPLWTQFFGPLRQNGAPFTPGFFKNDLTGFVKPSSLLLAHSASSAAFAAGFRGGLPEYVGYLGWPMLGALAVAAMAFWPLLPVRMTSVTFGALAVCSLGGTPLVGGHDYGWLKLPWYWVQTLPVAGSVLADRFSILADGAAAALFAFGVDAAWRAFRGDRGRWGIALAAALAAIPLVPGCLPVVSVPGVPAGWTAAFGALRLPAGASVLTVPVPTATLTGPLRWQAASGVPASLVGGYFIGPARDGRAYVGGDGPPAAASYLNQLWLRSAGETGTDVATSGIPQASPAVTVRELRDQIAAWHPAAVLAVTSRDSALGRYLISALGPPAAVAGDVLGWRLGAR